MPSTPIKSIALYSEDEADLWRRAEAQARESDDEREGAVLARILCGYLGVKDCGHDPEHQYEYAGNIHCEECETDFDDELIPNTDMELEGTES